MNNYRGFAEAIVPLQQVNFLVGENSTGKSSFLDLIDLFFEFHFWVIEPSFPATGSKSRNFFDLISASHDQESDSFSIGAVLVNDEGMAIRGMIVTYVNHEWRPVARRVSVIADGEMRTIEEPRSPSKTARRKIYLSRRVNLMQQPRTDSADSVKACVNSHNGDSPFDKNELAESQSRMPFFMRHAEFYGDINSRHIPEPFDRNLVELAPIRTKPRRTYDAPQTGFSPEGDHTPYLVKKTLSARGKRGHFEAFLRYVGTNSGLFTLIGVKDFGRDPQAPFEIQVELGNVALGMHNVGYGVSQVLPVLVEAFARSRGTAFSVQQPEVHLHPRAQAAFGDVVALLAREENKMFFIETHSDFAIDRFRLNTRRAFERMRDEAPKKTTRNEATAVSGRSPSANHVVYFFRDESGNHSISIPILEDGTLSDDQPESYRAFFLRESLDLL